MLFVLQTNWPSYSCSKRAPPSSLPSSRLLFLPRMLFSKSCMFNFPSFKVYLKADLLSPSSPPHFICTCLEALGTFYLTLWSIIIATVNMISLSSCLLLNQKNYSSEPTIPSFHALLYSFFFAHYIRHLLSALTSLLCLNIFTHSFHSLYFVFTNYFIFTIIMTSQWLTLMAFEF